MKNLYKMGEKMQFPPISSSFPFIFSSHQASDECFHFSFAVASLLVELVLSLGADKVMVGILGLVVSIAIDVVCKEADSLHIGE